MVVIELAETAEFAQHLQQAGPKAVFVDFFATWCAPCRAVAPTFEQLSNTYGQAVFLKVDVDKLEDVAQQQGVTAMPTFMCFRNKLKVDEKRGGDKEALEVMVKKWAGMPGKAGGDNPDLGFPQGQMNIDDFMNAGGSECLNESDDHTLAHALDPKGGFLESDVDEQLIITIAFNQQMKVHSFKLVADGPHAPKTIKFFLNLPNSPDFDSAESMTAVQELVLTEDDMKEDNIVNLKYVKFQNVLSITMFVKDNQGEAETTRINDLILIGSPVSTTNMNEFKRIAGKKGESH